MYARAGFEVLFEAVINQGIQAAGGGDPDISAFAAITAIRSPKSDIFFTPKRHATRTAIAGFYKDFGLVEEFHDRVPSARFASFANMPAP